MQLPAQSPGRMGLASTPTSYRATMHQRRPFSRGSCASTGCSRRAERASFDPAHARSHGRRRCCAAHSVIGAMPGRSARPRSSQSANHGDGDTHGNHGGDERELRPQRHARIVLERRLFITHPANLHTGQSPNDHAAVVSGRSGVIRPRGMRPRSGVRGSETEGFIPGAPGIRLRYIPGREFDSYPPLPLGQERRGDKSCPPCGGRSGVSQPGRGRMRKR